MPPALRGRGVWKETEERDIVSSLEKKGFKRKKQGTKQVTFTVSCSCVSRRHDTSTVLS